jgi:photosystem II stability/assembly factor-like uncharacterized protein
MKKLTLIICLTLVSGFAFSQWIEQNPILPGNTLNSVFFTDANTGYAVGSLFRDRYYVFHAQGGIILKTIDGGAKWDTLWRDKTPENYLTSIFFTDANTGYAVGGSEWDDIILKTTNGGTTWDTLSSGISVPLKSVYFTDSNTGYAVGLYGLIIKTIDGGATWIGEPNFDKGPLFSVFFTDANTGYVVGRENLEQNLFGIILKTIDGGTTWTLSLQSVLPFYSVYFTDSNTGYAVGGNSSYSKPQSWQIIMKTLDGGANWIGEPNFDKGPLFSVFFVDANIGYAVGEHGTIIKTIDGGTIWTNLSSETTSGFNSVFFTDANAGYAVGASGTILKTTNGGGFPTAVENVSMESTFIVYPNPATNKISIETHSNLQGETTICIFNMNGEILQLEKFQRQNLIEMDVSAMAKGIYLLKIQTKTGVETKKLVVQ